MTAERLLRLYPRAWRERYGDEFLATVGSEALRAQQVIDIVSGAIDAWLSPEVRRTTRESTTPGEATMNDAFKAICNAGSVPFTAREGWIGSAVMIGGTILLLAIGIFLNRRGLQTTGEILKALAFPVSMTLSMPLTYLKGQPWKAQVAVCAATLVLLAGAGYIATLI